MSLSDGTPMMTMPIAPANGGNSGGFGWGGDGAWLIILFLIFAVFGWGGNGWGNNGNSGGVVDGYVLTSDFASVERKLDSIANGICDSTFALNNAITGGFATTTQAINTGFGNAELSRSNQQAALMQQLNAMQMQAANCCCENRAAIAQVRYDMAAQACDTRNTVQNATRDIIDAMNSGFRGIDQRLTAQEIAAKDAKIAEQNQRLFAADLAASQSAQTLDMRNYVSAQFAYYNPRPVPSFSVPAPYQYTGCGCGCNQGCGC